MNFAGTLTVFVVAPIATYLLKATPWGERALSKIGAAVNALIALVVFVVVWWIATGGDGAVLEEWLIRALAVAGAGSAVVGIAERVSRP